MSNKEETLGEGMYYEELFSPEKLQITETEGGVQTAVLTDKNGVQMTVEGNALVWELGFYLRKFTPFKSIAEITKLSADTKTEILQDALSISLQKNKPVELKFLFNEEHKLRSIVSPLHQQVNWATIRRLIERIVRKHYGSVERVKFTEGRSAYRLPIQNENVSAWVNVDMGNNLALGNSGIKLSSRFRTERGVGGAPPCLNWAHVWDIPSTFFNIDIDRLDPVKLLGMDKVEDLSMRQIHVRAFQENYADFREQLTESLIAMRPALENITMVINQAVKEPLDKNEMNAILDAYKIKAGLPAYLIKQIQKQVKEPTVWGFSNAVSYVRTHGEFRESKNSLPVEDRYIVHKLENIAGEVLSLTPTIRKYHETMGKITLARLMPKQVEAAPVA